MAIRDTDNYLPGGSDWAPHRRAIAADDAAVADLTTVARLGVDGSTHKRARVAVTLDAGTTGVVAQVLFWNTRKGKFVVASPALSYTLTASAVFNFDTYGNRFFVHLSSITGTTKLVDVDVGGAEGLAT